MKGSSLYRVKLGDKSLEQVPEVDLATLGLKERFDLQEWICTNPSILGEPLLLIGKEFSAFDNTSERVDLVAFDKDGNVVIIELKRDDSGADVHWQAVKYASYFERATSTFFVGQLAQYRGISNEEAANEILNFTGLDDVGKVNANQRIILASHRFAIEATSAVLWLRKFGVDIRCVQLVPFTESDSKSLFLQSSIIIPVADTDEYLVRPGSAEPGAARTTTSRKKDDQITGFMVKIAEEASALLPPELRPDIASRWAGEYAGARYYRIWYRRPPWHQYSFRFQLWLEPPTESVRTLWIGFAFRPKWLEENGFPPDAVARIRDAMSTYASKSSVSVTAKDSFVMVSHEFRTHEFSDPSAHAAAAQLGALIGGIAPAVDEYVSFLQDNSNEQPTKSAST